jgi:esterase/lipase superfamily enzyme
MVSNPDDDLEVFVDDMRDMSDFVYRFANVSTNEGLA